MVDAPGHGDPFDSKSNVYTYPDSPTPEAKPPKEQSILQLHLAGIAARGGMIKHGWRIGGLRGMLRNSFAYILPYTTVEAGHYLDDQFREACFDLAKMHSKLGDFYFAPIRAVRNLFKPKPPSVS